MSEKNETIRNEEPRTCEIPGVEIFRAGAWTDSAGRTTEYSAEDIESMAAAHRELEGRHEAPVKLGHDPEQPLLRSDGLPAAGWLKNVRAAGESLVADLTGVPRKVYELIKAGAYKKRSLEVLHNFRDEATGRIYGHVAAGLALLGANLPAIGSLADIRALYGGPEGDAAAYFYESGSGGLLILVDDCQLAGGAGEDGEESDAAALMAEKIAALEARIAELEAQLAAPENGVEEESDSQAESAAVSEEPAGAGSGASDIAEPDESGDAPAESEIEGTPIVIIEEEEEETPAEAVEEPAAADSTDEAAQSESAPEEEAARSEWDAELSMKEQIISEAAEKLNAALAELEALKRRESERRWRERESFMSAHARKVPPAFRGIVSEVLALLDGDFTAVSDYSRGEDSRGVAADAFKGFISSIADHPAMSEYGRERGFANQQNNEPGAPGVENDEVEKRIRGYCAERGLNPDRADDYASAALAVLAYEQPPSLEERTQISDDPDEVLRYSNENVRKGLDSGKSSEYTVSMASNNSASGCAACEKRAGDSEHADTRGSDYGWWKDLERGVKDKRKEIEREVKEERDKILHKAEKAGIQVAVQYIAYKLKMIDREYRDCVSRGGKDCNLNAVRKTRQLIDYLAERMGDKGPKLAIFVTSDTKFEDMKMHIKMFVRNFAPEYLNYFDFL